MCLGIPGRVVRILEGNAGQLALVDVLGAQRPINLGMLEDQNLLPGDWIVIHLGFALEQIDEAAAAKALSGLQMMGNADGGEATLTAEDARSA
ncbi:MAG: hydrogenase maturation protein [Frankiales bacterium]|nr:hydrogenase maturation protein [Frankiales bacterium]